MNIPRAKGTMAETAVVGYLRANGFPYAERRSLNGALDKGDITGTIGLCWEVKYANSGMKLSPWIAETEVERVNSGADYGILVMKPPTLGAKTVHRWYAAMIAPMFDRLTWTDELGLQVGHPFCYSYRRLAMDLVGMRNAQLAKIALFAEAPFPVVSTTYAPGNKDSVSKHIKVMYLEDMVTMIRRAGYGQ